MKPHPMKPPRSLQVRDQERHQEEDEGPDLGDLAQAPSERLACLSTPVPGAQSWGAIELPC
jgi:hypothetical protein